jgi:hypothetical protein
MSSKANKEHRKCANAQNICWLHQKGGATNLPEENKKTPKI